MNKKFSLLILFSTALLLLAACSAPADPPFCFMNLVDYSLASETLEYSVTVTEYTDPETGAPHETPRVVNDVENSVWTLQFQKTDEETALLTQDMTVPYKADGETAFEDTLHSETVFHAFGSSGTPLLPSTVQKEMLYGRADADGERRYYNTAKDSYAYAFNYAEGKGSYRLYDAATGALAADPTAITVKTKNLTDVYDNEQLFYLLTAAVRRVKIDGAATQNSFKLYNVYDDVANRTGVANFSFATGDNTGGYRSELPAELGDAKTTGANIACVYAGYPLSNSTAFQGGHIEAYYSTTDKLTLNGAVLSFAAYRLIGYQQEITNSQEQKLYGVRFMLKSYARG
ncbi:MAG: hypothetical protein LBL66_07870 [Clostridiales bacterium]|jgi:hypothetical protein|nr:hypothetical protein [Clostridiales bacterium]